MKGSAMHSCPHCGQPTAGAPGGEGGASELAQLLAKLGASERGAGDADLAARADDDVLDDLIERTGGWGVEGLRKPEDEDPIA